MILELDCGNSRIKWRTLPAAAEGSASWPEFEARGLSALGLPKQAPARVRLASVARQTSLLTAALEAAYGVTVERALVVADCAGVRCGYREPSRLGVDRWLAVLAAAARFPGEDLVVVDAGTAVTVDVVSAGVHSGGFIGPGLHMMRAALYAETAAVQVPALQSDLPARPGDNTAAAVSGALLLMVLGLVEQARTRYAPLARLVITGGDGPVLLPALPGAVYLPALVMDGLAVALP